MRLEGLKDLHTAEGSTYIVCRAEPHSAIFGGAIAPLAPLATPPPSPSPLHALGVRDQLQQCLSFH